MKSVVRLCVDVSTLRAGRRGPATAGIWLAVGERVFPEAGWNDFVVVILERWGHATTRLLTGASNRETIHFMDGPFEAHVAVFPGSVLEFITVERGARADAPTRTPSRIFVDSLISAAEAVLRACREQSCWSVDADRLSLLLPSLAGEAAEAGDPSRENRESDEATPPSQKMK
jgi:hypothetical protein